MWQRNLFALAILFSVIGYNILGYYYVEIDDTTCMIKKVIICVEDYDKQYFCRIDVFCKSKEHLLILVKTNTLPEQFSYIDMETKNITTNQYFYLCYFWMAYNISVGIAFSNHIANNFITILNYNLSKNAMEKINKMRMELWKY